MRPSVTIVLLVLVLVGIASLALHIEASISEYEYVKPASPLATLEAEYDEGVFTYEGTVEVPNSCAVVVATSSTEVSGAVRIEVTLTEENGICLMLPSLKAFSGEIEMAEEAEASVFINGAKAVIVDSL